MKKNSLYKSGIDMILSETLPWQNIAKNRILISGATGLIGRVLIDVLMALNGKMDLGIEVVAIGRDSTKAKEVFNEYLYNDLFSFFQHDMNNSMPDIGRFDYIIHGASQTHPIAYSANPIQTITTNIFGSFYLLDYASKYQNSKFVFLSSVEIYGENRGDVNSFSEDYCGYIDSNTLRAGYPESKRVSESLCQAFMKEKGVEVYIPRLSRVYGPTMRMDDSKALSQFIKNSLDGKNIVLKSKGDQFYSYIYVFDAVSAIFHIFLTGQAGEAYNISDSQSNITLKNLAAIIAKYCNTDVVFDLPSEDEKLGFSKATIAILNSDKLNNLGWNAKYPIEIGVQNTIKIIREDSYI